MTRSLGVSIENSFVKGLITENSGLNFPENACVDVLNCTFTEKGEVYRRPAVDLEADYVLRNISIASNDAIKEFVWRSAGKNADLVFVVYQIGSTLYFWKDTQDVPLSDSSVFFTFDLEANKVSGAPSTRSFPVCFASGNSKLFIAHRYMDPFYLEYDETTGTLSYTVVTIQVRDFQVLNDGMANNLEPLIVNTNPEHTYNLYNQGWTAENISSWVSYNVTTHPAKTMVPWYFRDPDIRYGILNFAPIYRYKFKMLGTSLAPRGHLVYDAFNIDRSAVSGISGLISKSSGYERPTYVCFMNSRVFYGGVQYEGYQSTIYFSNILKDTSDEIFFYQKGDPTSETTYELLPNDGGVIVIPEVEGITAIIPSKLFLVVFCSNGVWAVTGSQGVGFSATDYTIEKISDVPSLSTSSFISVDHSPLWWNSDGIYVATSDNVNINVTSLTKGTIQEFYEGIPSNCKRYAQGTFNRLTSEISWHYSSDENNPTVFDSVLVFKTTTKAFYKHKISDGTYTIRGVVTTTDRTAGPIKEPVLTLAGETVTTVSGELVFTETENNAPFDSVFTFYLLYDSVEENITFGVLVRDQTIDWLRDNGTESFESYIESGYRVRGDAIKKFQIQYMTIYSRYIEDSSCKLSGIWDYSSNEAANGYTVEQEVCPNDNRRVINFRKLRMRGSGMTLQFKLRSVGAAPFHLIGWSCQELVNDRP